MIDETRNDPNGSDPGWYEPVLVDGRPVFNTIRLCNADGTTVYEDGKPAYRLVQRFIKDGRHVYIGLVVRKDSAGNDCYFPGGEEFAVEQDFPSPAKETFSPAAQGKLTNVLAPKTLADPCVRSAYSRAGLSIVALSQVMSYVSTALVVVGAIICTILANISFDAGNIANIMSGGIGDILLEVVHSSYAFLLVLFIALSSAIGLGGGILVERLILSNRHCEPLPKKRLGFGNFVFFAVVSFGLWALGVYIGNFADIFFPIGSSGSYLEELETMWPASIPLHVYAIIGAPVLEELACRKILIDRIHKYGQIPAMVVSGLLFGLLHGNSGQFFLAFFLGMVFAAVYLKTGNVIYTMLLHFMINLTASIPTFLLWAGIDVSPFFYFVFMPLMFIAAVVLLIVRRKDPALSLTPAACVDPAGNVFKNPGMLIAIIAGTVSLVATDFFTRVVSAIKSTPLNLLGLISALLVPVAVFLTIVISSAVSERMNRGKVQ